MHKVGRVKCVRKDMQWLVYNWSNIINSDLKRFALDGPDRNASYWAYKRVEQRALLRRQQGGGHRTDVFFFDGTYTAQRYTEMLDEHLMPFIEKRHLRTCKFQQDNALDNSAMHTEEYLMDAGLHWCVRSAHRTWIRVRTCGVFALQQCARMSAGSTRRKIYAR